MDFPQRSPQERLAIAAWIAVGLGTIWLGLPPYHYKTIFIDEAVWIVGLAVAASGITALFDERRPLIVVGLTLLGLCAGGAILNTVWRARNPGFHYGKDASEEFAKLMRERQAYCFCGLILGGVSVPLGAAMLATIRMRSDRPSAGSPGPATHGSSASAPWRRYLPSWFPGYDRRIDGPQEANDAAQPATRDLIGRAITFVGAVGGVIWFGYGEMLPSGAVIPMLFGCPTLIFLGLWLSRNE